MMVRNTGFGRLGRAVAATVLAWGVTIGATSPASADETSLFAAASTTNAMTDIMALFTEETAPR